MDTSIVDVLKKKGQASDFGSRSKLAKSYGMDGYTGTAEQNTELIGLVNKGAIPSQYQVASGATGYSGAANNNQIASAAKYQTEQGGPSITKDPYTDAITAFQEQFNGMVGKKPEAPSLETAYNTQKSDLGIDRLEENLNTLSSERRAIMAEIQAARGVEKGKPVALNVIEGRIGERERAANERLTVLGQEEAILSDQLKTKYNVLSSVMTYKGQDYQNARQSYEDSFSNSLNMINTVRGIVNDKKTDEEKVQDNARANAQVIYNAVMSGGASFDNLDSSSIATITKLELQAGLPTGFYKSIQTKAGKGDILSTTVRESEGMKYADVLSRDADGKMKVTTQTLGKVSDGSGEPKVTEQALKGDLGKLLSSGANANGKVSLSDYQAVRTRYVQKGFASDDFDTVFAKEYLNTSDFPKAGISTKLQYGL